MTGNASIRCLLRGAAAAAALAAAMPASAQSLDYGALEELFNGPITASATGSAQRDTDVPVNMAIVTADEIRRSGARDITGVLRHVPGVDVMQWGTDYSDVPIRGFNQPYESGVLVMVDGRQVYADYYGFVPWSALPVELDAIRQIEVVNGPNDALFGFNAAGGAINIITFNPRYDDVNTLTLRAGSPALGEVSGVATMRLGDGGGLRLSAGYRNNEDFSTMVPPGVSGSVVKRNMRAAVNANLVYAITADVEVAFDLSHTDATANEMSPDLAMQASRYLTNSVHGRLSGNTGIGMLQLVGYHNWLRWRGEPNPWLGAFAMSDSVTVVRAEDVFSIGADHTLRLEAGYRHTATETGLLADGSVTHDVWSGAAMWQWQMRPELALTTAIRLDHLELGRAGMMPTGYPFSNSDWNRSLDEISYNAGLVWTATDSDTLRLIASRGVELPSLVKSGALLIQTPDFGVTGNPDLKPTAVDNYEIAWNREIASLAARFQIAAFHTIKHNVAAVAGSMVMGPGGDPYAVPVNVGNSYAYGAEITAAGRIDGGWRWSLAYRLETINDRFLPTAADGANFVDFQNSTPKHLLKAGLGWSDERWEIDAFLNWKSRTGGLIWPANRLGPAAFDHPTEQIAIAAFASLDGRIAYQLADWATLAVSGQNLLQARQIQTSGRAVERQVFVNLTVRD